MLERLNSSGRKLIQPPTPPQATGKMIGGATETLRRHDRPSWLETPADDSYSQLSPPIRFKNGRVYNGTD